MTFVYTLRPEAHPGNITVLDKNSQLQRVNNPRALGFAVRHVPHVLLRPDGRVHEEWKEKVKRLEAMIKVEFGVPLAEGFSYRRSLAGHKGVLAGTMHAPQGRGT